LGCIHDLNAQPLVACLGEVCPDAHLVHDVPSALARQLAHGQLDAALIPVAEYLRASRYHLIPGQAIGCDGPAWSVKLISRRPLTTVGSVALDAASRTSAALATRLLRRLSGTDPRVEDFPLSAACEEITTDAVLLIGDRALVSRHATFLYSLDLGVAWKQWTGLPLVFAVWACHDRRTARDLAPRLEQSRRRSMAKLDEIASSAADRLGIEPRRCHAYLSGVLRYELGAAQRAGMRSYRRLVLQRDDHFVTRPHIRRRPIPTATV